ncbi:MAG: O-antigen ligase family protein [Candidatus Saccharimonadales bacterium]
MQIGVLYWRKAANIAGLLGIIVTLVLLPIDRLPYLHHIPFGLGLIALVLLLVATADRLLNTALQKDFRRFKKYILIGVLLALPVAGYAISYFYAIDKHYTFGAAKALLAVALRAYCFFVLVSERPALWPVIKKTIYITTAAVVAFGFFQYLFDVFGASPKITDLGSCCTSNSTYIFPRVSSTALEPLYLDSYLMIPIWLLTFDFLTSKKTRRNKYLLGLFIASSSLFILTIARSAILALAFAMVIFYFGLRGREKLRDFWVYMAKVWGITLVVVIGLVAMSGVASIFIPKHPINGSNAGVTGSVELFGSHAVAITDASSQSRYRLWSKSIGFIEKHPLKGVGAYNSRIELNLDKYKNGADPSTLQPFNNDLIGLLVDLGLLGIVTFGPLLCLLIYIIYRSFKRHWPGHIAPMALILVAMLIQSNFFHSILLARLWVVVGLLLVDMSFGSQKRQPQKT